MKHSILSALLWLMFLTFYAPSPILAENKIQDYEILENWQISPYASIPPLDFNRLSNIATITAHEFEGERYGQLLADNQTAIGIFGSFDIHSMEGNSIVGFSKVLANTPSETLIKAEMFVFCEYKDSKISVRFRLQELNQDHETLRDLDYGILGRLSGDYAPGDVVWLGFALVNGEVWFHTPKSESILKWMPLYSLLPLTELSDKPWTILGYASADPESHFSVTIRNVSFIYPF